MLSLKHGSFSHTRILRLQEYEERGGYSPPLFIWVIAFRRQQHQCKLYRLLQKKSFYTICENGFSIYVGKVRIIATRKLIWVLRQPANYSLKVHHKPLRCRNAYAGNELGMR